MRGFPFKIYRFSHNSLILFVIICITGCLIYGSINYYKFATIREHIFTCHCKKKEAGSRITIEQIENDFENPNVQNVQNVHLRKAGRILCWITTFPKNHSNAIRVKKTWGQRCDTLLFVSTRRNSRLPTITFPNCTNSRRKYLWRRTKQALTYIYENYYDKAEWFLKADEDTYVIMENLRYLLASYNTSEPIYFGSWFKNTVIDFIRGHGYMSGGAGYVLGKETLRLFVEKALKDKTVCYQPDSEWEDIQLGNCLGNIGVGFVDTRDQSKLHRFFHGHPFQHLVKGGIPITSLYWRVIKFPDKQGVERASPLAISFHHLQSDMLNVLEYLIYYLTPYGIIPTFPDIQLPSNSNIIWPDVL